MSDKMAQLEARVVAAERLAQRVSASTSQPLPASHWSRQNGASQ